MVAVLVTISKAIAIWICFYLILAHYSLIFKLGSSPMVQEQVEEEVAAPNTILDDSLLTTTTTTSTERATSQLERTSSTNIQEYEELIQQYKELLRLEVELEEVRKLTAQQQVDEVVAAPYTILHGSVLTTTTSTKRVMSQQEQISANIQEYAELIQQYKKQCLELMQEYWDLLQSEMELEEVLRQQNYTSLAQKYLQTTNTFVHLPNDRHNN
jgi:hypothetical protein